MTDKEEGEQVNLTCFVSANGMCTHTVEWLYEGKAVEDGEIIKTSKCSVTLVIPADNVKQNPEYRELFSCKVKDDQTEKDQLFTLSPQSAGELKYKDLGEG